MPPGGEYGVSGVVRDLKGAGIKDVVLDFVQGEEILGTVTTDETGRWSKSGGLAGVVKIVPRAENWKFEPGSLTVSIEDAGAVLNFVGTCYGYSISGTVVDREGDPVPGVQLLYFEDSMVYAMDSIADYAGRITTGPDGEWKIDSVNEIVTIVPVKTTYRFLPQVQEFVRASDGAKFIGLSGLTTHADGEGKITKEDLDESRVKLTAEATDDAYSFVAWLVTTVADNPDDPAGLIYVEEELEDESIIVTLDGPVKAIAYFQIVDAEPYIVGTFDVIHSFPPMALEEEFADELAASSKLVTAPKFDAAVGGDSFLQEYAGGDERIVMFDHFDYDRQSAELSAAGWQVVDHIEILNAYLVERDPTVKLYKELNELTGVYSEERNGIVKLFGLKIPNDQFYFAQWHYHQIRLAQAWSVTTGNKEIRVAVVDTGIDPNHRDLRDNLDLEHLVEADFTADGGDGIDYHGHGTHVAGTIGALTDNEILMSGVMWEVTIRPVKVFDASGRATNWTVVNGMLYAAGLLDQEGKPSNPNPVDIINLSLGGGWTQFEQDAVEKIDKAGIIIVAASGGNDGNPMVSYPAAHPEVIAVGAVGKVNVNDPHGFTEPPLADYSNWGSALDVVAPGGAGRVTNDYVWSTYPSYLHPAGGEYAGMGGTSMACPHVAGVVGLMLANGIEKEDVRDILRRTSMEIHLPSPNVYFGHGLVNAYWAVNSLDDEDFRFIQGLRDGNTVHVKKMKCH